MSLRTRIRPMLATLIADPFDDDEWIFEIKWDGYRAIADLNRGQVDLYSRNFKSFNESFPLIVEHLKRLNIDAVFDGELVALDKKGMPNFQMLQNRQSLPQNIIYCVFDLLYLDGKNLESLPLVERKKMLRKLLRKEKGPILYTDHIEKNGIDFFQICSKKGLEGIVGKKKESPYRPGERTYEWVKIKRTLRQEVIICGFTEPKGARQGFGSLVVAVYRNKKLSYAGNVGGGFTEKKLEEVKKLLLPLKKEESPFSEKISFGMPVTWVEPILVCEVSFSEWTDENIMRQPVFMGLREDKDAKKIIQEKPRRLAR